MNYDSKYPHCSLSSEYTILSCDDGTLTGDSNMKYSTCGGDDESDMMCYDSGWKSKASGGSSGCYDIYSRIRCVK